MFFNKRKELQSLVDASRKRLANVEMEVVDLNKMLRNEMGETRKAKEENKILKEDNEKLKERIKHLEKKIENLTNKIKAKKELAKPTRKN